MYEVSFNKCNILNLLKNTAVSDSYIYILRDLLGEFFLVFHRILGGYLKINIVLLNKTVTIIFINIFALYGAHQNMKNPLQHLR